MRLKNATKRVLYVVLMESTTALRCKNRYLEGAEVLEVFGEALCDVRAAEGVKDTDPGTRVVATGTGGGDELTSSLLTILADF